MVLLSSRGNPRAFLGAKRRFSRQQFARGFSRRTCCLGADDQSAHNPDQPSKEVEDSSLSASLLSAARTYQAIEDYKQLLNQPDEKIDLLKGAALIARHRYPLLDYELIVEQLDDLAVQVEGQLPPEAPRYPLRVLQAISKQLYQKCGFQGNRQDYYDADNSCINKVLERRVGIPITLALVYMEVASRVGLPMLGVNVPGHFFITPEAEGTEFLVDAFQGGEISFAQDVETRLEAIYGGKVSVPRELLQRKLPLPHRAFLARMLNNLKQVYILRKDYHSAYLIACYMQATRPTDPDAVRDAGVFLYYLQRIPECIETLNRFLELAPLDSEDAPKIRRLLESLRQEQQQDEQE